MSKDTSRLVEPLNWPEIVKETIRKRKEFGLNQKTHAALAGVSIPTMISFERAETTISMDRALAILEIVGMSIKLKAIDELSDFADQANKRWFELIQKLPSNSPGRHPFGFFSCFFAIKGKLREISIIELKEHLKEEAKIKYSGWSPFWIPTKKNIEPYPSDNNTMECWLGKKWFDQNDSIFTFYADDTDFWRASLKGNMYLQRGYQEDSSDTLEPGKIFDLILPIRTIGEIIHYAYRLASKLSADAQASIDFHVKYTGLRGRELVNWSDPTNPFFDRNKICVQNTIESSIQFQLSDIDEPLPEQIGKLVNLLLKDLYSKFGFYELKYEFIVYHLEKLFSRRLA
ncbi:MAG: helix-turn-helix transcriptional regulator [Alphaproteobacteria bacterium]|jgi:transcriptional regulator with XRE-family HTH domain